MKPDQPRRRTRTKGAAALREKTAQTVRRNDPDPPRRANLKKERQKAAERKAFNADIKRQKDARPKRKTRLEILESEIKRLKAKKKK